MRQPYAIEDLDDRIREAVKVNPEHGFEFLPDDQVKLFASGEEVQRVLRAAGLGNRDDLAGFVLANAQRIVLTLVMSNLSYLEEFWEKNIDDRSLPLRIHNRRATTSDQPQRQVDLSKWRRKELDLSVSRSEHVTGLGAGLDIQRR
ncbi:hypothetical protein CMUS01_16337 [Colletotrichum musicola]|uniref:Uncharacterized protein n=1 Tax=Colletotrichum musicola TaxID=2175873 RepID=A0A8H6IP02_9PEZI|nr:hypothetical protein CMUS01_16337 [Colletotrichum musicola]